MCKAKKPNTSAAEAEAARQAAAEEARYQQQLAAQQAAWEAQRSDAERRYQEQLKAQQEYLAAQQGWGQEQIAAEQAAATRGRAFADSRDKMISEAMAGVNQQFAGFDSAYFQNFADQFVAGNRVEADYDHERTSRAMKFKLADNRNLNSSAAPDVFREIDQDRNAKLARISAEGSSRAAAQKTAVMGQKYGALNSLLGLGNQDVPDFQTDADMASAQERLRRSLQGVSSYVASGF